MNPALPESIIMRSTKKGVGGSAKMKSKLCIEKKERKGGVKKTLLLILAACFLTSVAWGMYEEDTAPSEADAQYITDKEDSPTVTMPERETEMPKAMQDIRKEQKANPEEDFIEDNVTDEMRQTLGR